MELVALLVVVWVLSPFVLVPVLVSTRRRLARATQSRSSSPAAGGAHAEPTSTGSAGEEVRDLAGLVLLGLELERQRKDGNLSERDCAALCEDLAELERARLVELRLEPDTREWRQRRDEAWYLLTRPQWGPPQPPPWKQEPVAPPPERAATAETGGWTSVEEPKPSPPPASATVFARAPEIPPASPVPPGSPLPVGEAKPQPTASEVAGGLEVSADERAPAPRAASQGDAYAWAPREPSAVERVLQKVSGWPGIIAPFLVQNIGWFIGGFCFVAGTLFLVSYTTGFANAAVILGSLFVYTGFLLWSGYQMRRKRPDLAISSNVLLTIAMLLVPLNLTAAARVIAAGTGSPPTLIIGLIIAAAVVAGAYVAATLAGGLMDRVLQRRHARVVVAVSTIQLAAPGLAAAHHWLWLTALHGALLGLVAYGVIAFARHWVRSVFVDRQTVAYYAGGVLVFAAMVAYVYLTWSYPGELPGGYFGPFLMALCGLLFYLDSELKQWVKKYVFLTRVSFAVYALSIVSLLLCFDAVGARTVTLILGAGIYGLVLWKYLTPPPLYLLLGCLGWLYASTVLVAVPEDLHLLGSLPALAALSALSRWVSDRSKRVARVCLRTLGLTFLGLTAWSLWHCVPGLVGIATGLVATVAVYWTLFAAPGVFPNAASEDANTGEAAKGGPWLYLVAGLAALSIAFAPRVSGVAWATQFAFGLALVSLVWTWLAFRFPGRCSAQRLEVFVNCSLLSLLLAIGLGVAAALPGFPATPPLALLLLLAGCTLLWLAIELRVRWMIYGVLVACGVAAFVIKRTYFPGLSVGLGEMTAALTLWVVLWWLDRSSKRARRFEPAPSSKPAAGETPLTILWRFPLTSPGT